jgi:hypothetical protein
MKTPLATFTAALEAAETRAQGFEALGAYVAAEIGVKLFTVMSMDLDAGIARRAFTNEPEAYPVSGFKAVERDAFYEEVIEGGGCFIRNTIDEIEQVFGDHAVIRSLGCGSVLNIPIRIKGRFTGTLNLLDVEQYFDAATVARCVALLQLPGIACFLLPG